MPWWHTGAAGGTAWPWLGAALAKTNKIAIGTGVTAPILRYNPAIVAQVFATLGYMFPCRVFLGLGTGESLNEVPAGSAWLSNHERLERLEEAIKLLWIEEWVTFQGKYYQVQDQTSTQNWRSQSRYTSLALARRPQGWTVRKQMAL